MIRMLAILLFMIIAACSTEPVSTSSTGDSVDRQKISGVLNDLESALKREHLHSIHRMFDDDYYGGMSELSDRLEDTWRRENINRIQFNVDRILDSDGIYDVRVRWHKMYFDATGRPVKKSGYSNIFY